jgi:hypothetical protein
MLIAGITGLRKPIAEIHPAGKQRETRCRHVGVWGWGRLGGRKRQTYGK